MIHIKTLAFSIIVVFFVASCKQGKETEAIQKRKASSKSQNNLPLRRELVPFSDVHNHTPPYDTTLPNGIFLTHLVNRDTSDEAVYIKYGDKNFDSLFVVQYGVSSSPCHDYEVCYATEQNLAIIYQCMNSRSLTILPLNKTKPVIEHLNPPFIGVKEGFTISLMDGDGNLENGDTLLVADLDFNVKQFIKLNELACADKIRCFDEVKVEGNKLYLTYTGAVSNGDPKTMKQTETIRLLGKR
jgi:hypothetical protein